MISNSELFDQISPIHREDNKDIPDIVSLDDALANEDLVDAYIKQHSGPFPYAYYGDDAPLDCPGPCFYPTEDSVRQAFYKEKARREAEKNKN